MADELAGQVAIVTGGGRGIGRAIAQAFAAAGAAVTVTARSTDQLAETVALIETAGGCALAVPADVTDQAAVEQVVKETEARFGPVDLLVNNAAIIGPVGPVWESDPTEWRRCVDISLYGTFLCTRTVLPGMMARRRGRIISLTSGPPMRGPTTWVSAYGVAKVGIVHFTETIADEAREHGVVLFAVAPGGVWTSMAEELTTAIQVHNLTPGQPQMATLSTDPRSAFPTPPEAPARLSLLLASGKADALSGRYFNVIDDMDEIVRQADTIQQNDLRTLRMRT
jgi:NAD(P)-dependent dehydrogenase (short-subunit alcohol dehydrogenase family)